MSRAEMVKLVKSNSSVDVDQSDIAGMPPLRPTLNARVIFKPARPPLERKVALRQRIQCAENVTQETLCLSLVC